MDDTASSTSPALPGALSALVVKQGLMLGGLKPGERALALALVWALLPDGAMSEREVNQALKAALAGAAACLDTDHVELRRWLVDTGFVQRDGYGRAYLKVPARALPPLVQAAGQALQGLQGLDVATWVATRRAEHARARQARRAAWQSTAAEARP